MMMKSIEKNYKYDMMNDNLEDYYSEEEERRIENEFVNRNDWQDFIH